MISLRPSVRVRCTRSHFDAGGFNLGLQPTSIRIAYLAHEVDVE